MAEKTKRKTPKAKMEAASDNRKIADTDKEKKLKKLLKNPIFHYFLPMAVLCLIMAGHMYLSIYVSLYMFVLMTTPGIIVGFLIGVYLYLTLSSKVRKVYFDILGWRCWAYNPIYYTLYIVAYRYAYNKYLNRVRNEESYLFSTEGAFLSYVFKVFPLIILLHFTLIFLRWAIKSTIVLIKKQKAKKAEASVSDKKVKADKKAVEAEPNPETDDPDSSEENEE